MTVPRGSITPLNPLALGHANPKAPNPQPNAPAKHGSGTDGWPNH